MAVPSTVAAAKMALTAGIDIDVWDAAYETLQGQVEKGQLDVMYIDRAVRRILTAKFKLGLFDDPYGDRRVSARSFATSNMWNWLRR